jgi:hypothetical protein
MTQEKYQTADSAKRKDDLEQGEIVVIHREKRTPATAKAVDSVL